MTIKVCLDPMHGASFHGFGSYPEVGKEYVLIENEDIETGEIWYIFKANTSQGAGGNTSPTVYRYHGWRGTTNNIQRYALGVRRVLKIVEQKNGMTRITLSDDLKKDED